MVQKADQNEATHAQESQDLTVDGCVCPQCYKPLKAPTVTDYPADRYGRCMRSYSGMCFHCRRGCRVVQFERDGKWLIHSFMPHRYESGKFVGIGPDWFEVNPLPEPPAVLTGPGGDYDKVPDLTNDPAMLLFQSAHDILAKTARAFAELIEGLKKLQHNEPDKRKH